MEGCVFLDRQDRQVICAVELPGWSGVDFCRFVRCVQMILLAATGKVMELAQCGVPVGRRFTFFDQVTLAFCATCDIQLIPLHCDWVCPV